MLRSAANASTTLTTWAFGTTRDYLGEARRWLEAHDLDGIRIVDATGLSADNTASAVDVARLMALVDDAPTLRAISGQRAAWLPGLGPVASTNGALGAAGIDSGKTGSLNRSGRTVVVGDPEQHHQARTVEPTDHLVVDPDLGLEGSLHDGTHRRSSSGLAAAGTRGV